MLNNKIKKINLKKYIKEKTTSTRVNLTNPLHAKWDWDKKIITFLKNDVEKKRPDLNQ
jgi:hypothetical protein